MTREEFEKQQNKYFQEVQWNLAAKYAHRFVWAMEVYGEIKPHIDFLDFFVEMNWNELNDGY